MLCFSVGVKIFTIFLYRWCLVVTERSSVLIYLVLLCWCTFCDSLWNLLHLSLCRSSQAREQPPPRLRSCQRKKAQCILPSRYTVYTNEPCHTVYMFSYTTCVESCIRVRCISFGFGVCPLYWEDQVFEYKYVVNLHWGWIWEISAFSFLFWNFYLNNASSVGQTRCHCSDHLFIRGVFSTQPMFQSMEPTGACQVYILPRHQATSIFDKKIWRKKTRIVTFSGKLYIVSSIVCHLTKLENMGLFLY